MSVGEPLNEYQIALIRTLWELAQGRIDSLYPPAGAEEEKVAVEIWMTRVFPKECSDLIRANSPLDVASTA